MLYFISYLFSSCILLCNMRWWLGPPLLVVSVYTSFLSSPLQPSPLRHWVARCSSIHSFTPWHVLLSENLPAFSIECLEWDSYSTDNHRHLFVKWSFIPHFAVWLSVAVLKINIAPFLHEVQSAQAHHIDKGVHFIHMLSWTYDQALTLLRGRQIMLRMPREWGQDQSQLLMLEYRASITVWTNITTSRS